MPIFFLYKYSCSMQLDHKLDHIWSHTQWYIFKRSILLCASWVQFWAQKWTQIGSNIRHLKMYHWVIGKYRRSPHRASPHSTDFSIVWFFKNMNSSHRKVHPLYSTVFTVDKKWVLYCIFIKFTIPLIASRLTSIFKKSVLWCYHYVSNVFI